MDLLITTDTSLVTSNFILPCIGILDHNPVYCLLNFSAFNSRPGEYSRLCRSVWCFSEANWDMVAEIIEMLIGLRLWKVQTLMQCRMHGRKSFLELCLPRLHIS